MKWHDYLISYSFETDKALAPYNGSTQLSRIKKINSFEEVNSVTDFLTKQHEGAKNLIINNIMYLGKNYHD